MTINIDENSGYCLGVVRAIEFAEKELEISGNLYSLGEIIHNPVEIERLNRLGLKTINTDEFTKAKDAKVLIRAHGEPPKTYELARMNGIEIIDATCPIVTKVQERIRDFYKSGYQIIIFGKKEHAEVIGLNGVCDNNAIVIRTDEEARSIMLKEKNVLFSQTTMDVSSFKRIVEILRDKVKEAEGKEKVELVIRDTVCKVVYSRDKSLREFAKNNDVIIFVSGKNSSNGKALYRVCKNCNEKTFFIERSAELNIEWFKDVNSVGITGATSTPKWVLEEVKNEIVNICSTI
jgi:4-hydroxy-3-methylbut-2-en-1-yl diphosphate reductase